MSSSAVLFVLVDTNCIHNLVATSLLLPMSTSMTFNGFNPQGQYTKSVCMANVFLIPAGADRVHLDNLKSSYVIYTKTTEAM